MVTHLGSVILMQISINPVPRTYVRGIEAFPLQGSQNNHPRAHARGVLWYGVNAMARIFSVLSVSALLLSGCIKVGPDFVKPPAQVEEKWIEKDPKIKSEPADHSSWWTVFNDPVLNSLVETAYKQNLPLRIAGLRILEARAQLGIAVGRIYPQLQQASGDISGDQISDNAPNAAAANKFFYDFQAGFDAAWELDFWGRFRRGVESADANLSASIADYDDVLVSLVSDVAATYVQIRTFEERLKVALENVRVQGDSLRIAEVRFSGGAVTELDVTQAKALLRDTQSTIPVLQTGLRQAQNALSILLGMPPRDLQDLLGGPKTIPTAPTEVTVGIPAELLGRRPDIRRAELQAAAQSAQIGVAKADLFPAISISGSFGLESSAKGGRQSNGANFSDLFESNSFTYFFGPSFQWPILNYGRIRDNVRVQDVRFQELVVNYQNTVLRAAQEVEDAIVAFLRTQEQARFLSESVESAKRSVELSLIQYREGATDYQRVLDSQGFLVQQQDRLTLSLGDVPTSLIAVYKALGGGWQIREGKDFIPEEIKTEMNSRTDWGNLLQLEEVKSPPKWEPDF
ncbi:MAG: efflux transporter outer membrane subunit [Candidatus Binatia bacterium]